MIETVRQWLLCLTGAALLAALAQVMLQEGWGTEIGKLLCGLVLIFAVLKPLGGNMTDLAHDLEYHKLRLEMDTQLLQNQTDERIQQVIEEKMSAYSMDKAAQAGIECQIRVECRKDQDIFLPQSAHVTGISHGLEQEHIKIILTEQLGISAEDIVFQQEDGG